MSIPLLEYKNLILHLVLTITLSLLLTFLKIPIFFLQSIHTYIHPDHAPSQNGIRAAIRRPGASDSSSSSKPHPELKRRNKSKDKSVFDESNAQIFRLRLDESHLVTRLYFTAYRDVFNYFVLAVSCLLLNKYLSLTSSLLDDEKKLGGFGNGDVVAVVLGCLGIVKVSVSIVRVSFEKSASRKSEKQLSLIVGVLGFVLGVLVSTDTLRSVFDIDFGSVDGFGRFCVAVLMGAFAGFLFMPAVKNARAFWIGTDQLRWNLSIISCGWISRFLFYVNYIAIAFTALLWIKPFAKLLVKETQLSNGNHQAFKELVGHLGMSRSEFVKFRVWALLVSGIMQIIVVRPNLQMYLNEAVLSWYQRLHASKLPDLEFSRAKVFLHNHYLCLVVLQFFGPPVLVLLLVGLSQLDAISFEKFHLVCSLLPCSILVKQVALFMAWWVIFVWFIFTFASLLMYRRGLLYVS